jgi:hypothetical protein
MMMHDRTERRIRVVVECGGSVPKSCIIMHDRAERQIGGMSHAKLPICGVAERRIGGSSHAESAICGVALLWVIKVCDGA